MVEGVRNFKIINKYGAEWDLMDVPKSFFINPTGLGWGMEAKFERIGYTYYTVDENEKRSQVKGTVVFDGYETYAGFLEFIQQGGLVFAYKPLDTWYYVRCIARIDKSEINYNTSTLECPITIDCKSYWYRLTELQTATGNTNSAKEYAYEYPYTYEQEGQNIFKLNCRLPSYFKLTVFGECEDPAWTLYADDEEICKGAISYTIPAGHKMVVDTYPESAAIRLYDRSGNPVRNLYAYSDSSTMRLFALPQGRSTLVVTTTSQSTPTVVLEVMEHV